MKKSLLLIVVLAVAIYFLATGAKAPKVELPESVKSAVESVYEDVKEEASDVMEEAKEPEEESAPEVDTEDTEVLEEPEEEKLESLEDDPFDPGLDREPKDFTVDETAELKLDTNPSGGIGL